MIDLNLIKNSKKELQNSEKMPLLFVGHGSPMNAITVNKYSTAWKEIGQQLTPPNAILCISAHWLTNNTSVAMVENPKTIHDFGGFPDELFQQQYPAPGAPDYARYTIKNVQDFAIKGDFEWGLDHGAWSVLQNMYPKANIPVYQMSINYGEPLVYHYQLAKQLSFLRRKGVLIVCSGNVVHNLRMIKWREDTGAYDWAIEFDSLVKSSIEQKDDSALIEIEKISSLAKIAHPTIDHYIPLIYTLGLREQTDELSFFNDDFDMGSISMRSVILK